LKEAKNESPDVAVEETSKSQPKETKNEAPDVAAKESTKSQPKEPKNESPDVVAIKNAVAFLNPGEISDFSPSGENGFIAILEKREPPADAKAGEKKAAFEKRLLDNKQRIVLFAWLRERQEAAGLKGEKG
jgi:hypothetical protein